MLESLKFLVLRTVFKKDFNYNCHNLIGALNSNYDDNGT